MPPEISTQATSGRTTTLRTGSKVAARLRPQLAAELKAESDRQ
jgi:hypothetical protein